MSMYPYNSNYTGYYGPSFSGSKEVTKSQFSELYSLSSTESQDFLPSNRKGLSEDSFTATGLGTDSTKPDLTFKNFTELTPENIRTQGNIKGVVFDVDDTLSKFKLDSHERSIPTALKEQLLNLQDSGMQLGIVSNNPNGKLVQKLQNELAMDGIQVAVISNGQKPSTKGLKMMQEYMGLPANQMMMIGDNPNTDVESGKKAGFKTAQVDWFQRHEVEKDGMKLGDKLLGVFNKIQGLFDSKSEEPQLYPPSQAISVSA